METDLLIDELSSEPWGTLVVPTTAELLGGPETTTSYFIKSKFSSASYTFLVTDLTSVWVQSCDRADVKRLKQVPSPLATSFSFYPTLSPRDYFLLFHPRNSIPW